MSPVARSLAGGRSRTSARTGISALVTALAVTVALTACDTHTSPAGVPAAPTAPGTAPSGQPLPTSPALSELTLSARPAPPGWHKAALPKGAAVLAFPPVMHLVDGDAGTVTAARVSPSGAYLLYLNATPRQGDESLRDWPSFRVGHQRDEDATQVRLLAVRSGVRFIGGTGTCVIDAYVTRARANHYTELACFVRGRTSASVIIATSPTANWPSASGLLTRAVSAYQVR